MYGNHLVFRFLIMLALLIGLSSCGGKEDATSDAPDDPKARWLEGKRCAPPCWENIHPGITHPEDAIELLKVNPIVESTSVQVEENQEMDGGLISWTFADESTTWSGRSVYRLSRQSITAIYLTAPDLCLGEIINVYGEPDHLLLAAYEATGAVDLVWQSYGFVYETSVGSLGERITKDTCGGLIAQFPLNTPFHEIPVPVFILAPEDVFVPWIGYGHYGK